MRVAAGVNISLLKSKLKCFALVNTLLHQAAAHPYVLKQTRVLTDAPDVKWGLTVTQVEQWDDVQPVNELIHGFLLRMGETLAEPLSMQLHRKESVFLVNLREH